MRILRLTLDPLYARLKQHESRQRVLAAFTVRSDLDVVAGDELLCHLGWNNGSVSDSRFSLTALLRPKWRPAVTAVRSIHLDAVLFDGRRG